MPTIDDYLTKQIYIDKNVVTFRSLSRQFGIHVNAAKNELAKFHSNSVTPDTRSFATYLVSGEPFPKPHAKPTGSTQTTDDSMEVDSGLAGAEYEEEDQDEVPITTMTLVGESDLEDAKSKYARIFSMHVYCLSPSPLNDTGLISGPSVTVYKADAVDAPASSIVLGRIVGPDVRIGKVPPPMPSSSKAPAPVSRKPTLKGQSDDAKPTEDGKRKTDTIKPKASGTLDWSKAKKTPETEKKNVKVKKEESAVHRVKETTPTTSESESPKNNGKRGVKRKAAPPPTSDTEDKPKTKDENPKPVPVNDIRLRKNRIVSDDEDGDEDEEAPLPKPKGKGKSRASVVAAAVASVAERSLREMMEIDDNEVENASKGRPQPKPRSEPAVPSDEDIEMATSEPEPVPPSEPERDDDEDMEEDAPQPKPKPRKKKAPKEPVPIGRNGLKKKQVKHTVITTDAKGYMKSTDVYEYESVDEEEAAAEEAKEVKKPAKGKKASATKPKKGGDDDEKESAPKPLKPVARSNSVKKSAGTKPKAKPSAQGSLKTSLGSPRNSLAGEWGWGVSVCMSIYLSHFLRRSYGWGTSTSFSHPL
ncbi:DNA polymerase subunit Cdc27 [Ganoderma leucocontextum]|nr:DNA polymerase subunit Cdc27 [Ganoderma leucocontextum]